jgi:hypothetical protein
VVSDTNQPLPASVCEYMTDRHGATPTEVMDTVVIDERFREQVEHYCAVTRFTLFKNEETNDTDGLRWDTVKWSDVAEWDVPEPRNNQQ